MIEATGYEKVLLSIPVHVVEYGGVRQPTGGVVSLRVKCPVPFAEQNCARVSVAVDHHQVRAVVSVEVRDLDRARHRARMTIPSSSETAVSMAKEDGDGVTA